MDMIDGMGLTEKRSISLTPDESTSLIDEP